MSCDSFFSQHLSSIPLVLVFGIATAVTAVHQLLPHQVSSLLSMEKFQAPPSSQYLTSAIQNVSTCKVSNELHMISHYCMAVRYIAFL